MDTILRILTEWLIFAALLWHKPTRRLVIGFLIFVIAIDAYVHLQHLLKE
jgi:hypothetical protein